MEVLTAAILGPAQRRVNATACDLRSGQADLVRPELKRLPFRTAIGIGSENLEQGDNQSEPAALLTA
jgi:hypothetical protein